MTKHRPATLKERAVDLALGLFLIFICANVFSFIAQLLFIFIAGFFDPTPELVADCKFSDYLGKSLEDYQTCKDQSAHHGTRVELLRGKIPWFWIGFLAFAWKFLKNPIKGLTYDNSEDIIYPAETLMWLVQFFIFHIVLILAVWAALIRDIPAFIALGLGLLSLYLWHLGDRYFRKKFGRRRGCVET